MERFSVKGRFLSSQIVKTGRNNNPLVSLCRNGQEKQGDYCVRGTERPLFDFELLLLFFSLRIKAQLNTTKPILTHRENGWYHVLSADSLSAKPIITVKDMVGLKLKKDYYGKYAISGRISKHKINKWADETEKSIGKQIAFVYNDSIISAPQVNTRIESGTFMITSLLNKKLPEIYKGIMKEKSDSIEGVSPTFTTNVTLRLYFHRNIHKLNL